VVLCTRNRPRELEGCLQALDRLHYPGVRILVVENGPPDGETRAVAERHGARYLNSLRYGLSRARNDGARACTTDLVAFTDDDARPHPEWLNILAREFADPRVMAAAGEVLPPSADSGADSSRKNVTAAGAPPAVCDKRLVVDMDTPHWFSLANFGGIGDGSNMCFRRSVFESWVGFDERLGRGAPLSSAEEHLAFFQLILAGHRCTHAPEAIVWHHRPQTPDEWRRFQLGNLTDAVAYAALLWSEYPQTRRLLLRHLWNRISRRGSRRPPYARGAATPPSLSLWDKLRVVVGGLLLFARLPRAEAHGAKTQEEHSACALPPETKDSQKTSA
jgi:GT2 family glycosyltransferase